MVQLSSLFFAATLFLGTIASPVANANVNKRSTVTDDIVSITGAATTLSTAVDALPLIPILAPAFNDVIAAVESVTEVIVAATADIKLIVVTLAEAEADLVVADFKALEAVLVATLNKLEQVVAAIVGLILTDLHKDLVALHDAYIAYIKLLEGILPAVEAAEVDLLNAQIGAALSAILNALLG
jgi:hypothetical protein